MKKDIFLVLLIVICVGLAAIVFNLLEKSNKFNKSLEEEKYSRMVAEESLQKNAAKLTTLEAQLKKANEKLSKVEDSIDAEKSVNEDLQRQYDELKKTKADLEAKLRNLAAASAAASSAEPTRNMEVQVAQ